MSQVIEGSVYISFEDGNDGDNVTPTILGNSAVSSGVSVTYNTGTADDVSGFGAQSATKVSTAAHLDVDWLFRVGGVDYNGTGGTRGVRTTGGANGWLAVVFAVMQYPISSGIFFKITSGATSAQWDLAGWYQYFQLMSLKPDGALKMMAHWAYSGQSTPSSALTSGQQYYATSKRETDGNLFTINIYEWPSMDLVTSRTGTVEEDPLGGADMFVWGSIKYGEFHDGSATIDWNHLILNTDGVFPLLPQEIDTSVMNATNFNATTLTVG